MKKLPNITVSLTNYPDNVQIGDAAKILSVSIDTLRRWEKDGKLVPDRTPGGTRIYSKQLLESFLNGGTPITETSEKEYTISEAAKKLGVSPKTLRRWDTEGKLTAQRDETGQRIYSLDSLTTLTPPTSLIATHPLPTPTQIYAKSIFVPKKFIHSVLGVIAFTTIVTALIVVSYLTHPVKTRTFFATPEEKQALMNSSDVLGVSTSQASTGDKISDFFATLLSPFNQAAKKSIETASLEKAAEIGILTPQPDTSQLEQKMSQLNDKILLSEDTVKSLGSRLSLLEATVSSSFDSSQDLRPTIPSSGRLTADEALIGGTIVDSYGSVYPSNQALSAGNFLSLGTSTNKYSALYVNGISVDSGGNFTVSAGSAFGRNGADYIYLYGNVATDIIPKGTVVYNLGSNDNKFREGFINTLHSYTANISNLTIASSNSSFSSGTSLLPSTDNSYDLGTSTYRWRSLYLGSNAVIGGTMSVTGDSTLTGALTVNGNTTLGNASTDTITPTARISGSFIPSSNGAYDLGSSALKWNNLYVNTISSAGTSTSGQAVFTYSPTSNAISEGSLYMNPTTATAAYPLISVAVGGTEKARITSDGYLGLAGANNPGSSYIINAGSIFNVGTGGNVGIGTTAPGSKLEVIGQGTGSFKVGSAGFGGDYTGLSLNGTLNTTNYNLLSSVTDQNLYINSPSGSKINFRIANGSTVSIQSNGSAGALSFGGHLASSPSVPGTQANGDTVIFYDDGTLKSAAVVESTTARLLFQSTGGSSSGFGFFTGGAASAGTEKVTINNAGNVGIGTTAPSRTLELNVNSGNTIVSFQNPSTTTKGYLGFHNSGTMQISTNRDVDGTFSNTSATAAGINLNPGISDSNITFYTSPTNNSSPPQVLKIDKDGNLGFGTNGTFYGKLNIPISPTATSNYGLVSLGSGAWDGSTSGFFNSSNGNGTVFAINTVSGYGGNLIDAQVAGSMKFRVNAAGNVGVPNGASFCQDGATSNCLITFSNTQVMLPGTGNALTSNNVLDIAGPQLTTGTALALSSTATSFDGELLTLSKTGSSGSTAFTSDIANIAYSQTFNGGVGLDSTGNVLDISRSITLNNTGNTHTISGALASFSDSGTQTAGTLTSTADVLRIAQNYTANSGAALNITSAGAATAFALRVNDDGTFTDTTPFVVDAGGNVGIGTTAPTQKLDVNGIIRSSGGGGLQITSNYPAVLDVALNAASGDNVILNNWGDAFNPGIIIGTTRTDGTAFQVSSSLTLDGSNLPNNAGTARFLVRGDGNVGIGANTPVTLFDVNRLFNVTSGGNVGIGTTAPGAKLEALSTGEQLRLTYDSTRYTSFTESSTGILNIVPTHASIGLGAVSTSCGSLSTQLRLCGATSSSNTTALTTGVSIESRFTTSATTIQTGLYIGTIQDNAVSATTLANYYGIHLVAPTVGSNWTITNRYGIYQEDSSSKNYFAGNVGIGTTSPSSKVDVTTNSLGVTQTTSSGLVLVNTTAAAVGAQQISPAIRWSGFGWKTDVTAASQAVDFRAFVTPVQGTSAPTGFLGFGSSINGGAYSDNQLVLTSGGNVGIGTTSPVSVLSLGASTAATGGIQFGADASPIRFYRSAANALSLDNSSLTVNNLIITAGASGGIGITDRSGSTVWQWYVSSNIARLWNGSGDVLQVTSGGNTTLSANGAASTPAQTLTGTWFTGGTSTTTKPQLLIEPSGTTSTNWSTSGTALGINTSSTTSGLNLLDLQSASTSRFSVQANGVVTITNQLVIGNQSYTSGRIIMNNNGALNIDNGLGSGIFLKSSESSTTAEVIAFGTGSITRTISGSYATHRFNQFPQSTITAATALNISSEASTLSISGAPISAGSATIANAYGLKIDSGTSVAAGVTNAYGLAVAAPTGATNNYAAIFTGGSVGIGITNPLAYSGGGQTLGLDVYATNAGGIATIGIGGNVTSDGRVGDLNFYNRAIGGSDDRIAIIRSNRSGANNSGSLEFHTKNAGSWVIPMTILPSGNVGIGTTSPSSKLDITTAGLGVTQTTSSGLALVNTTAAAAGAQQISPAIRWSGFGWKTDATAASQATDMRSFLVPVQGTANPSSYLTFESSINGGTYGSSILALTSGGNVGVGTTSPGAKFQVVGTTGDASQSLADFRATSTTGSITSALAVVLNPTVPEILIRTAGAGGSPKLSLAADTATPAITILTAGSVGIGTTTPSKLLDVQGEAQINLASTQTSVALCGSHAAGSGAAVSDVTIVDCTGTPAADYMEMYPGEQGLEYGDIVTGSSVEVFTKDGERISRLTKTSTVYDTRLLGVISDKSKAGDFNSIGYNIDASDNPMPLALAGRILVKVTNENGAIKKGDYITSSSTPGFGMKSTRPATVVGIALEDWDRSKGFRVMVLIKPTFADPTNILANLTLDQDGSIVMSKIKTGILVVDDELRIKYDTTLSVDGSSLDNSSLASVGSNVSNNEGAGNGQTANYVEVASKLQSIESSLMDSSARWATQSAVLAEEIASQSAQLAETRDTTTSLAAQLASASAELAQTKSEVELLKLTPAETLMATGSATLANLNVGETLSTFNLSAIDTTISGTFKALGDSFLGTTTIAGNLSVDGTTSITGDSINVIGTPVADGEIPTDGILYIQNSPLANLVNFFNGAATIDAQGILTAVAVKAQELLIADTKAEGAEKDPTIGTATLPSGQTSITIGNNTITNRSKVFLTPKGKIGAQSLVVEEMTEGISFKVSLDYPLTTDLSFDWLIVNTY